MSAVVIPLPTAAPRKVHNGRWAAQRRAAFAARQAWPGYYRTPREREHDAHAAVLVTVGESAEMRLLQAILDALDDETRFKIAKNLAPGFVGGSEAGKQAWAVFKATKLDFGDQHYLRLALDRLRDQGGR